jgi:hypothetical protein
MARGNINARFSVQNGEAIGNAFQRAANAAQSFAGRAAASLDRVRAAAARAARTIATVGTIGGTVSFAGIFAGLRKLQQETLAAADNTTKLAEQLNILPDKLAGLELAFSFGGTSIENARNALVRFATEIQNAVQAQERLREQLQEPLEAKQEAESAIARLGPRREQLAALFRASAAARRQFLLEEQRRLQAELAKAPVPEQPAILQSLVKIRDALRTVSEVDDANLVRELFEEADRAFEEASRSLINAQRQIQRATRASETVFDRLGVAVTDAAGRQRETTEILGDLADAIKRLNDTGRRPEALDALVQLFGRTIGPRLFLVLSKGRESLEEFEREAERFGLVFDESFRKAAETVDDSANLIRFRLQGLRNTIFRAFAPLFAERTSSILQFFEKNESAIKSAAERIGIFLAEYYGKFVKFFTDILLIFNGPSAGQSIEDFIKNLQTAAGRDLARFLQGNLDRNSAETLFGSFLVGLKEAYQEFRQILDNLSSDIQRFRENVIRPFNELRNSLREAIGELPSLNFSDSTTGAVGFLATLGGILILFKIFAKLIPPIVAGFGFLGSAIGAAFFLIPVAILETIALFKKLTESGAKISKISAFATILIAAFSRLKNASKVVFGIFASFARFIPRLLTGPFGLALALLSAAFPETFSKILSKVADLFGKVIKFIIDSLTEIPTFLSNIFKDFPKTVGDALGGIETFFSDAYEKISTSISEFFERNLAQASLRFENFKTSLSNIFTKIWDFIKAGFRLAIDDITSAFERLGNFVRDLWTRIGPPAWFESVRNFGNRIFGNSDNTQGMASGGLVRGPGTGTSDSVLRWLSNGEYVLRASAVRKIGLDALNAMNAGLFMPGFPVPVPATASGPSATLVFELGGKKYETKASVDVIEALKRDLRKSNLAKLR